MFSLNWSESTLIWLMTLLKLNSSHIWFSFYPWFCFPLYDRNSVNGDQMMFGSVLSSSTEQLTRTGLEQHFGWTVPLRDDSFVAFLRVYYLKSIIVSLKTHLWSPKWHKKKIPSRNSTPSPHLVYLVYEYANEPRLHSLICHVMLCGKSRCNKRNNVHPAGCYLRINPFSFSSGPHLNSLFFENHRLDVHYP